MIKFRLYFDKDKETEWLNRLAASGCELRGFFLGFYRFDKGEPGRYAYQVDFSRGFFSVEQDYREFMEEQGIEIVCLWGPWVFLRRRAAAGEFRLYSDTASLLEHYGKIRRMFKILAVIEIVCFMLELISASELREPLAYAVLALVGLVALVFANLAFRLSDTIDRLKEESGEAPARSRRPSILMVAGMLACTAASILQETFAAPIPTLIGIIGISLMLVGLMAWGMR